jgi:hypothetical protein
MNVILNTRARYTSYVDSDIKALGFIFVGKRSLASPHQVEMFVHFLLGQIVQIGHMPVRRYQQVPRVIGI